MNHILVRTCVSIASYSALFYFYYRIWTGAAVSPLTRRGPGPTKTSLAPIAKHRLINILRLAIGLPFPLA